jgi:oxygen-dependent protoporphyrinogen oxidase
VMLGGTRWREAVDEPDDVLRKRIEMDLDRTLGLCGAPEHVGLYRWPRAVAQPDAQHVARILDVRARAARLSGVALAGGYLDGVSVSDALASGRDLAPAA